MKVSQALDTALDKDTHDVIFVDPSGKEVQLDASDYDQLDALDIRYQKIAVITVMRSQK